MFIGLFGLPPVIHEDDPLRGVQCAIRIAEALEKVGAGASIGVTTGKVFCGAVGNDKRREFVAMGDVVNLSARLMVAASKLVSSEEATAKDGSKIARSAISDPALRKSSRILCDRTTHNLCRGKAVFQRLPEIQVKGKSKPIPVFRPLALSASSAAAAAVEGGRGTDKGRMMSKMTRQSSKWMTSLRLFKVQLDPMRVVNSWLTTLMH